MARRVPLVCLGDKGVVLSGRMGISTPCPWNRNSHKLDKHRDVSEGKTGDVIKTCDDLQITDLITPPQRSVLRSDWSEDADSFSHVLKQARFNTLSFVQ